MRAYEFLKSNNSVLKIDQQTYESNISFSDYERAVMEGGHSLDKPKSALHQVVSEIVNTSIMKNGWKKQEHRDGLDLRATANEEGLSIFAYDVGGREIGFVHFEIINNKLESFDTWVDPRMRRQGIATVMYNYAKELGNDLAPSTAQTPDGKKFWKSIKKQQTIDNEQGVAEGKDFDRCFDQACKLYDRAVSKNLEPKLVQVADFQGDGNGADPRWMKLPQHVWQHYVVIVGDQVLDPTAKQFGDSMPTQYQVSDLDRLWGKQYQIRPRQGMAENFADGKNPQDKGDSKRHGIPKHATLAQLDKIAKEGGRRGQLAHWQANMRRGRK